MLMHRKIILNPDARGEYRSLEADPSKAKILEQVRKVLAFMEVNLEHPSLQTHKLKEISTTSGDPIFEAYVQQHTPGAYRIFFHYGPDELQGGKRIPVLTILAIIPHP